MRTLSTVFPAVLIALAMGSLGTPLLAAEKAKTTGKDPLSKFKDDDLAQIRFCFEKFVEAIGTGDAKVVKTPRTIGHPFQWSL